MSNRLSILKSLVVILPIVIVLSNDSNNWNKTLKDLTTGTLEYKACKLIIYKESSYNARAVSGSHYGLAQGRSKYLKTATPQQQIVWFTKYVKSRYGTCQAALAFHLKHGYY
jgi:hypothetical protein